MIFLSCSAASCLWCLNRNIGVAVKRTNVFYGPKHVVNWIIKNINSCDGNIPLFLCRIWGSQSGGYEEFYPCGALKVNWRFGGTYRHLLSRWFLARLIFRPWRWRRYVPPKRRFTLNGLRGVISQKMALYFYFFLTNMCFIHKVSGENSGPRREESNMGPTE
jgi:hypothetical protein